MVGEGQEEAGEMAARKRITDREIKESLTAIKLEVTDTLFSEYRGNGGKRGCVRECICVCLVCVHVCTRVWGEECVGDWGRGPSVQVAGVGVTVYRTCG